MRFSWAMLWAFVLAGACSSSAHAAAARSGGGPLGLAVVDLLGQIHRLGDRDNMRALVLVFLQPGCEVSDGAIEELNRLHGSFAARQVELYGIVGGAGITRDAIARHYAGRGAAFPIIFDPAELTTGDGRPTHAAEAFVFDADGGLAYRGRIDERPGPQRGQADRTLEKAVEAVLAGRQPEPAHVPPRGVAWPARADEAVTYSRHIAPLLNANCVTCHRPGEVAPFSLASYQDAAKRAAFLSEVTERRLMPPWHARPHWGEFRGDRRLTERSIELIAAWQAAGAPEGDLGDLPPPPRFAEGWQLGQPDLVLEMNEPFDVAADGPDSFRFFVIPIDIPEDRTVAAIEFRPGNPAIVHHAIMYLDTSGVARKLDAADPAPGYEGFLTGGFRPAGTLGFWAPGYTPRHLPEGVGQSLSKGADLALQLHYHPSGKAESDRSQLGIYFAKEPVAARVEGFAMINFDVDIPAGATRHKMTQTFTAPVDVELLDVTPHMHMIGTEMKVLARLPDGTEKPLVWSDWNFNWQEQYLYRRPLHLPAGTRFELEACFDNSDANPYNPNRPPKHVAFGEMTTDEMCICAFRVINRDPTKNRVLQQAMMKDLQAQLANPKVLMSVMTLLKRGLPPGEPLKLNEALRIGN